MHEYTHEYTVLFTDEEGNYGQFKMKAVSMFDARHNAACVELATGLLVVDVSHGGTAKVKAPTAYASLRREIENTIYAITTHHTLMQGL